MIMIYAFINKKASAYGGLRPPDSLLGLCSWTSLGDFRPPDLLSPLSRICACFSTNIEVGSKLSFGGGVGFAVGAEHKLALPSPRKIFSAYAPGGPYWLGAAG